VYWDKLRLFVMEAALVIGDDILMDELHPLLVVSGCIYL